MPYWQEGSYEKPFVEHRREFIENLQYGKQIDDFLDIKNCQKRPQAPKPIFVGLESEKSGNLVPNFENFKKYLKFARGILCAEWLWRFSKRAHEVPNWSKTDLGEILKHCKNAVII